MFLEFAKKDTRAFEVFSAAAPFCVSVVWFCTKLRLKSDGAYQAGGSGVIDQMLFVAMMFIAPACLWTVVDQLSAIPFLILRRYGAPLSQPWLERAPAMTIGMYIVQHLLAFAAAGSSCHAFLTWTTRSLLVAIDGTCIRDKLPWMLLHAILVVATLCARLKSALRPN